MSFDNNTEFSTQVDRRLRTALWVSGVVAVLAGIASLVLPHATLFAVSWVFGIYLAVSGITMIVRGASRTPRAIWRRIGLIVLGLLVVAGGAIAILVPPVGVRWIALLIGFAWLLEGIALVYSPPADHRVLTIVMAVLSIVSGILVINLPYLGAVLTVAAVGSVLIVFGIVQIATAIGWDRAPADVGDDPAPDPVASTTGDEPTRQD